MREKTIKRNTHDSQAEKCKDRCLRVINILRKMSLFEINTGIFHNRRQDFVPKTVSVISLVVAILMIIKIIMSYRTYNHVYNIMIKNVEELDLTRYNAI